ncbi:hypothetical protein IMG5_052440 [Ichthyophthirius multifiliis]|uniref:Transmembrane protein n=1 Tax=Ichthyophthirius multifiliis TaxID=5932 RepID=G0QMV6_ICHMU|nr:hypothetical protein IMG5_052440 [Ichthyophthirius multifiliis]EGR33449.1 hypothetical protein IMG5_052440 [Ichthyophthirius multifiliis]|eukprot:XP_004037435.1 hypothetical protein IMG5_052440 [Ichthyophthirius multifiliis]
MDLLFNIFYKQYPQYIYILFYYLIYCFLLNNNSFNYLLVFMSRKNNLLIHFLVISSFFFQKKKIMKNNYIMKNNILQKVFFFKKNIKINIFIKILKTFIQFFKNLQTIKLKKYIYFYYMSFEQKIQQLTNSNINQNYFNFPYNQILQKSNSDKRQSINFNNQEKKVLVNEKDLNSSINNLILKYSNKNTQSERSQSFKKNFNEQKNFSQYKIQETTINIKKNHFFQQKSQQQVLQQRDIQMKILDNQQNINTLQQSKSFLKKKITQMNIMVIIY